MLLTVLIILGVLTLIVLGLPDLVLVGLILGILPGLILAVVPTIFGYLLVFTVIRAVLPFGGTGLRSLLAIALTLGLSAAIALPRHLAGRAAFSAASQPDVTPDLPVRLAGHIRLERPVSQVTEFAEGRYIPACDALCAALLATPGVTAVTHSGRQGDKPLPAVTYRLVPAAVAPGSRVVPVRAEEIVNDLPRPSAGKIANVDEINNLRAAVTAGWALRLGGDQRLIVAAADGTPDMTIVIHDERPAGPHRLRTSGVSITARDGKVLFRRRSVTAEPIAPLFAWLPQGNMMPHVVFEQWRTHLRDRPRYTSIEPVRTLFERTSLHRPAADPATGAQLRESIAQAAATPGRSAMLSFAPLWLGTLDWMKLPDADVALVGALIDHPGFTDFGKLYDGYERHVSPTLRPAIARRLLRNDLDDRGRSRLNAMVLGMPAGTYATPLPEEERFIRTPALRRAAPALVERLADRGAPAAPLLASLIEEDAATASWAERWQVLRAERNALIRLGPDGAAALPVVTRLLALPNSSLTNTSGDGDAWRLVQLRLGVPPAQLVFPPTMDAEVRERARRSAVERLTRYRDDTALD